MKLTACARSLASRAPSARQRAPPHQHRELGAQAGSDHLGPVGGHHQRDAGRLEPEDDLGHLLLVAHGPGAHVRGGADLEHHPALERAASSRRGSIAVMIPWPMRSTPEVQHLAHLLDEGPRVGRVDALLAGVQRHPQAGVAGALHQRGQVAVGVGRAEVPRGRGPPMSMAITPRSRKRMARSTIAAFSSGAKPRSIIRIRPARTGYSSDGPVDAVHGGHHDGVQVALAAAVALGRVEAHLVGGDPLRPVAARDHPVDGAEDPLRAALDQLGEVVDPVEARPGRRCPRRRWWPRRTPSSPGRGA